MLSRAGVVARRAMHARGCASQAHISPAGIDRENPQYAPSYRREWKHYGYTNVAEADWKEWSDLPAPYKYYHVKVDPADVEAAEQSTLWKLFTNWTTAIPLSVGLAIPLFAYDVSAMLRWARLCGCSRVLAQYSCAAVYGGAVKIERSGALAAACALTQRCSHLATTPPRSPTLARLPCLLYPSSL